MADLAIRVQPRAKRTEVAGVHGGALKMRLAAPPVEGKANDAVVKLLATHLDVPPSRVELVSGATSRVKRFRVTR